MKLRLIVETDGGEDIKREASVNRQGRRKAQSLRDLRLLFNSGDVFFFTRISVGSFGLDIALYIVLRGQAPDAGNRGFLGFGIETCAVLSERSEEHTSELQSLMRISYAVFCLKKKNKNYYIQSTRLTPILDYTYHI